MQKFRSVSGALGLRYALLASAAAQGILISFAVQAQTAPTADAAAAAAPEAARATDNQDIVVTATRREERLIDIPLSIQAVSGEELAKTGAVNFADYARTIAGVSFLDSGPGRAQIFIRGVSTGGDVDTGKESTVGVYIDETPVTEGSSQPDLKLYDIDRVEVLRGPQGTLYGSGSLGGTVRILTNQPRFDEVSGYLQLTGSTTRHGGENGSANGWINVPLSDTVAVRAVGYVLHNSGFLDNGFSGEKDINHETTYGGRLALRVQPTENLNIVLTGYYQDTEVGAYNRVTDRYPALIINQSVPEPFDDRYGIVNLKLDLDLGFATLTSSSSYFDRQRYFENDIDYFLGSLGAPSGFSPLTYDVTSKAQELRLASTGTGRFRWLVGGFYLDRVENFNQTINFRALPPPTSQAGNVFFEDTRTTTEQYAAFGELSYDILPSLTATAGVRLSKTNRSAVQINDGAFLGGFSRAEADFSERSTTPKFNLSYKPSEDSLLYIQAAKGFRTGGINPGLPPCGATCTVEVSTSFGSDSLWNYEAGAKLQLFDKALSLTASAFLIDWKNIQLNVNRGDGFNGFLNAGDARSKGFEVEANGRIGEQLRFGGQVTYTDAALRSVRPGVTVAAPGTRLPDIARWTVAGNAEWGTAVGENGYAYVRGDVQYVGPRPSELGPTSLPVADYTLVNLRVGFNTGPYQLSLFANNLTDERAQLSRTQLSGVLSGAPVVLDRVTINVPRTIGISVARSF
ncbi:TonB-dependent receptor [Sphingopyxis sp. MSC1_008]|uniref:TonB-dependent receptor n=1 Tax=Sphingopyxis sp. MSC1_008 TaxID=2909265 RepID=UPI0020C0D052|nr:TonB-dependent receptor [Sphingopyxis sp. MSC1_008]